MQTFYTYSEATGNVLAGATSSASPMPATVRLGGARRDVSANPLDPQCSKCFGPLNTTPATASPDAVYRAPLGINVSGFPLPLGPAVHHLRAQDLNGDGFAYDFRAAPASTPSAEIFSQLDMRLSKDFTFANRFGVELIGRGVQRVQRGEPDGLQPARRASAYAGDPLQGEQRLAQLGVRQLLSGGFRGRFGAPPSPPLPSPPAPAPRSWLGTMLDPYRRAYTCVSSAPKNRSGSSSRSSSK